MNIIDPFMQRASVILILRLGVGLTLATGSLILATEAAHAVEMTVTAGQAVAERRPGSRESIRQEAEQAQEELSQELGKTDAPVAAMKAQLARPDPSTFRAGDLLWPRKPQYYIPYGTQPMGSLKKDKAKWEREKQVFVEQVKKDPRSTEYDRALASRLKELSFEQFHARYIGDGEGELSAQGWIPYVGHVAMLFFKNDTPWVVEAIPGQVRTIAYTDWLSERGHEYIWHGRVGNLTDEQRLSVVAEALQQDQKPYEFWNFNLADGIGFYCSKLVWHAMFRAVGLALDDDPEPRRFFWYSPKQMIKSRHIQILYSPGDYATASVDSPNPAKKIDGPAFDKSFEGQSCELVFSDCIKKCRTPELESCAKSCCCRFGGVVCPDAPNCCAR